MDDDSITIYSLSAVYFKSDYPLCACVDVCVRVRLHISQTWKSNKSWNINKETRETHREEDNTVIIYFIAQTEITFQSYSPETSQTKQNVEYILNSCEINGFNVHNKHLVYCWFSLDFSAYLQRLSINWSTCHLKLQYATFGKQAFWQ